MDLKIESEEHCVQIKGRDKINAHLTFTHREFLIRGEELQAPVPSIKEVHWV